MSPYFTRTFQRSFGTFPLKGADLTRAVEAALEAGYRAFDTAQLYENEAETGAALAASGLPRDELLVTTKVHPDRYGEAEFMPSVERSVEALGLGPVDVLLLHWPAKGGDIAPSLTRLAEAKARGLARHVGVSNYTSAQMREAKRLIGDEIATNQVEFHPLLDQSVLLAASAETGIPLASYCSVARGEALSHPLMAELAADYGRTPAQICLRWILQKGVSINTMSTKPANIRANFNVMDFTLSTPDMARLDALGAAGRRIVDADRVPWAPDWD